MNTQKIFCLISFVLLAGMVAGQPGTRIKLTQLEQAPSIDGSRKGMIGLSNAAGDQRYAFYVNVADTCISYTPTDTGNTTVSIFVQKCATDSIWYIDYEGRSILLAPYGAGSDTCDVDWLQISDASCPDALTDSIFTYKYAAVGARYVWPGAEFLVNDSTASAIEVIQGSRNARTAWYDSQGATFSMMDHGGSTPTFYIPVGANMIWKTTAGTPQTPVGSQVNHWAINAQDSTVQAHQYPNTRVDTNAVENFLYTDPVGKFRSQSVSYFIDSLGFGLNIYNSSGNFPVNVSREARLDTLGTVGFYYPNGISGISIYAGDDSTALNSASSIASADQENYFQASNTVNGGAQIVAQNGVNVEIGGFNASPGQLLQATVGGNFIFADPDTISAANIYNSNGNFPASLIRNANLDTGTIVSFNYSNGNFALQMQGNSDSVTTDGLSLVGHPNGTNSAGFSPSQGDGFYINLNGLPTEGQTIRAGGDNTFYFSDFDSLGVNFYNSNGNFPPDNNRIASLDSASSIYFNYPSGTRILEMFGGSDSSALGGYISFFSPDALNTITLNNSGIESLWSNDQSFSIGSQDGQNSITQDTSGLDIVGIDDATNAYTISAQKAGPVTMRAQQQNADRIADIILDLNVGNTPISLFRAYDISASITLNEIRIDTSGVGINTRGGVGDEGDILQSNGAKTFWGGDGTFNADQLSFTPNGTGGIDQWIAVTANRYNSSIFPSGTSTPSESITEILADTSATTSTVNLNYTPDSRYTSTFTTVRYLYNFGSGNMTVQTNQSWQFKTITGSATTLTIASGENYKLIWKEGATAADSRFYAVKLQ